MKYEISIIEEKNKEPIRSGMYYEQSINFIHHLEILIEDLKNEVLDGNKIISGYVIPKEINLPNEKDNNEKYQSTNNRSL